jgi:hypothetical protein
MAELFVYAVGDSIMWGQGLDTDKKFAMRAAMSLAQARGLTPKLKLRAHSGARIKARREDRDTFADRFPALWDNDDERDAFRDSAVPDERPAERLHGEINRAFPTVLHQLRRIPDSEGRQVDILLINGGADDLDFASVLEEEAGGDGDFLKKFDKEFERVMHDDIIELLRAARRKCPNAHIVVTGYYSPFSIASRFGDMEDFFLQMSGKKRAYEYLSILRLTAPVVGFFFLGFVINRFFWSKARDQIRHAVDVTRALSDTGESRWLYWLRRAVTEINEDPAHAQIRGPGVAFAAPGFTKLNSAFAESTFIWQEYEQDELDDDKHDVRAAECPRNGLREEMVEFLRRQHPSDNRPPPSPSELAPAARVLNNELDGPLPLLESLARLVESPSDEALEEVNDRLSDDIDRIDLTRIGSVIHPNREGAARYAEVVHKRAEELRETSVRDQLRAFLPPGCRPLLSPSAPPDVGNPPDQPSPARYFGVGEAIRRMGFDPSTGFRACLAHAEPDVIGLRVKTNLLSDLLIQEGFLHLGSAHKWHLGHLLEHDLGNDKLNPHFRPGTTDFFTIDVAGQIKIGDITRATIEFGPPANDPDRTAETVQWNPGPVTLSIDGHDVVAVADDLPQGIDSLRLEFPKKIDQPGPVAACPLLRTLA